MHSISVVLGGTIPVQSSIIDVQQAIQQAVTNGTLFGQINISGVEVRFSALQQLPILSVPLVTSYVQVSGSTSCTQEENFADLRSAAIETHAAALGIATERFTETIVTTEGKTYNFTFRVQISSLSEYVNARFLSQSRDAKDENGTLKFVAGSCSFLSASDASLSTSTSSKFAGAVPWFILVIIGCALLLLLVGVVVAYQRGERQARRNDSQMVLPHDLDNSVSSPSDDDFTVEQYAASHYYPQDPDYVESGELRPLRDNSSVAYLHDVSGADTAAYGAAIQYLETLKLGAIDEHKTDDSQVPFQLEADAVTEDRSYMDIAAHKKKSKRERRAPPTSNIDIGPSVSEEETPITWADEVRQEEQTYSSLAMKHLALAPTDSLSQTDLAELTLCCSGATRSAVSSLGLHARHVENYTALDSVFRKILAEYHGVGEDFTHRNSWELPEQLGGKTIGEQSIPKEAQVMLQLKGYRNFSCFPLSPAMTEADRREVEDTFVGALTKFQEVSQCKGRYYSLTEDSAFFPDSATLKELRAKRLIFPTPKDGPEGSVKSQIVADWPCGRGSFVTEDENIIVWVGGEDHFKVAMRLESESIAHSFSELNRIVTAIEHSTGVPLARSDKYGVLTCCPSRVGPALTCQCSIFLPRLRGVKPETAIGICMSYGIKFKYSEESSFAELISEGLLCQTEAELASGVRECIVSLFDLYGVERDAI